MKNQRRKMPEIIRETYAPNRDAPHDSQAEAELLGSVLNDPEQYEHLLNLDPAAFYLERHRLIANACHVIADESPNGYEDLNLVTVAGALSDAAQLDDAGGMAYLTGLGDTSAPAAYAHTYAARVKEKHQLRTIISASLATARAAYEPGGSLEDVLEQAAQLGDLAATDHRAKIITGDTADQTALAKLAEWRANKGNADAIPTGFYDLDRELVGLENGQLVILAARPSMGKTALALGIANAYAANNQKAVVVFSLEMPADQLAMRSLASEARVDLASIRHGNMTDREFERLQAAADRRTGRPLRFIDDFDLTPEGMRARLKTAAKARTLGLVVLDYLQLLSVPGVEDERLKVTRISRALKMIAREFNVPVLALSQLSRALENRQNKRPMLSDLRESGSIEQDADVVLFIYRDDYYNANSDQQGTAEIIIGKQRNGPVGFVRVGFDAGLVKFYSLTTDASLARDTANQQALEVA